MLARKHMALPLVAAVAIGVGLASVAGGATRSGSETVVTAPRTLVSLAVPIRNFAQDGDRLAWMTGRCSDFERPVDHVAIRAVSGGPRQVLAPRVCGWNVADAGRGFGDSGLVLAGTRALFWWPVEGGNFTYHRIATAALENRRVRALGVFGTMGGELIAGVGGERGTFVHAVTAREASNDCLSEPIPCVYTSGGRVLRVGTRSLIPIPGVPVAAALDASRAKVAVAPAARRWSREPRSLAAQQSFVPAAVNGTVQIRDARTGAVRAAFVPRGRVVDLAFAARSAAVLVDAGAAVRIERYDAESGRLLASARVPETTQDIDVAGGSVVYRVGSEIRVFVAGRTRLVARASAPPVGLSIVGRRIAWAENVGGRGRIRSVALTG